MIKRIQFENIHFPQTQIDSDMCYSSGEQKNGEFIKTIIILNAFIEIYRMCLLLFSCLIPECETRGTDAYNASWLRNAVPFSKERPSACYRYARISNKYTADQCTENHFNRSKEMRCTEYVYKTDEVSILNDVKSF